MKPSETILLFDTFLVERRLSFNAVVIGGTALALLGVTSRQTKDCDVLYPSIPMAIQQAAQAFADNRRSLGEELADNWLNNGPSTLIRDLPEGWMERLQEIFRGRAITLQSLGRIDLLRSKLFALCDRGLDISDCLALGPSESELEDITPWLEQRDANPDWPGHVLAVIADLKERLRHGL